MTLETAWLHTPITPPSTVIEKAALERQAQLTKPPGSLTQLENIAVKLAAQQRNERPQIHRPQISVFAADHGIANKGVSAFPQAVTAQMIANFIGGGAAISVLAQQASADLEVVNLGTQFEFDTITPPTQTHHRLYNAIIANATEDFSEQAAMNDQQCQRALLEGANSVERAKEGSNLFIGGEMGIANTSSACALASVLLQAPAKEFCGYGTGIDEKTFNYKVTLINKGIQRFDRCNAKQDSSTPSYALNALRELGGFEIAGLCGAYIRAAQLGRSILLDGVISSVAALLACRINPGVKPFLLASHLSAEVAHKAILRALDLEPLIEWSMRLGEGSGAAVCLPLLDNACALHNNMATFSQAGVSQ